MANERLAEITQHLAESSYSPTEDDVRYLVSLVDNLLMMLDKVEGMLERDEVADITGGAEQELRGFRNIARR